MVQIENCCHLIRQWAISAECVTLGKASEEITHRETRG